MDWELGEDGERYFLFEDEGERFRLMNMEEHLAPGQSPYCRCGHHLEDHGYDDHFKSKRTFCFAAYGDERFKPTEYYWVNRCPCKGFQSSKTKEAIV